MFTYEKVILGFVEITRTLRRKARTDFCLDPPQIFPYLFAGSTIAWSPLTEKKSRFPAKKKKKDKHKKGKNRHETKKIDKKKELRTILGKKGSSFSCNLEMMRRLGASWQARGLTLFFSCWNQWISNLSGETLLRIWKAVIQGLPETCQY